MKWILAASQLLLLLTLQWRRGSIHLPALRAFLLFAVISSILYDPWNASLFAWLSIPSVILRTWVLFECLHLLTHGLCEPFNSLMLAAQCIGGLIVLTLSWAMVREYSAGVTLAIYCAEILAGAYWVMLGMVWLKLEWPQDWRGHYALGIGLYFAVLAIARACPWPWSATNNVAMGLYAVIFAWLAKQVLYAIDEPRSEKTDDEDNEPENHELYDIIP